MLGSLLTAAVDGRADNHWNVHLPGKEIRPICGLIHNWIDSEQHEIHAGMEDDWSHSGQGCANGSGRGSVFGNRRVNYAVPSELLIQVLQAGSGIPGTPDSLPDNENARISCEQLSETFPDRLGVGKHAHV